MDIANLDQAEHWNTSAGHWLDDQAKYDGMLAPFIPMLLDGAGISSSARILDVGCGCGATTRAAARAATSGHANGADLSRAMLARARERAEQERVRNVTFEEADAQVHPFPAGAFDAVISRFGVMFFSDPPAAFANVRRATREGGRLAFVCWRAVTENPWVTVPMAALTQHVPPPPPAIPGAPGMFAFADPSVVRQHLEHAGWHAVALDAVDTPLLVGGPGTLDDAVAFLANGSLARTLLAGADDTTRANALDALRAALAPHVTDDGVRLDSAVWLATATA